MSAAQPPSANATPANINLRGEPQAPANINLRRDPEEKREDREHHGAFARFTAGLGIGHIGNGDLPPKPGFKPVHGLSHTSPVLSLAGQIGGGTHDMSLALELLYEQMLTSLGQPSPVGFHLVAIGLTGSSYSEHDWFATAHLRWVGLIYRMSDCGSCFFDQLESTGGPGVGLTLGKEWFARYESDEYRTDEHRADEHYRGRRKHSAIGLALQGNYARFIYTPKLDYFSGLLLLTFTSF